MTYAEVQVRALSAPDILLMLAVLSAAYGYAEGASHRARELGGWRVICWALVLTAPVLICRLDTKLCVKEACMQVRPRGRFAYVGVVSVFLGFFAWYAGLARGGIARVSQLQLIMLPLAELWSVLLLHEKLGTATIVAACAVVCERCYSRAPTRLSRRRDYRFVATRNQWTAP